MWWTSIRLWALLLITIKVVAAANILEIMPNQKLLNIPVNSVAVLYCQPNVEDTTLVEGLSWLDINGQTIQNDASEGFKARKYTEAPAMSNTVLGLNLIIKLFQKEDSGNYTCTARYQNEILEASITLVPFIAITFVDVPKKQNPIAGQEGLIKCVVEAQPVADIHWYKDGQRYIPDEGGRCSIQTDGIRCSTFSLDDNGSYSCQARVRKFGTAEEQTIEVDVYTKPIIQHSDSIHEAKEGESLFIKCSANGNPKPTYAWLDVMGQDFKGRFGYDVDEIEGTLEINKIAKADAGFITCVAKNTAGQDEREFKVEVIVKPTIRNFENKSIADGEVVALQCHIDAEPDPKVKFIDLGTNEEYSEECKQDDDRICVKKEVTDEGITGHIYSLNFDQARREYDGLYQCVAENNGGIASAVGHLEVQYIPVFINATSILRSWINHQINISCISSAIPNASITWEFNEKPLDPNITVFGTGTSSTISIFPVSKASFGNYSCKAKNKLGDRKHTVNLLEATVPGKLLQVVFYTVTATTITFQLIGPEDNGGYPITDFAVKYRENEGSWEDPSVKERIWKIDTPYILEKLVPEGVYHFSFAAINQVGAGPWSDHSITMPKKAAPEEPVIIKLDNGRVHLSPYTNRYQLLWKIPQNNGENISDYQVAYYAVKNASDNKFEKAGDMKSIDVDNSLSTSFMIEGLSPGTYYKVEIRAHNIIGYSQPGSIIIKTQKDPASVSIVPTENSDSGSESALTMAGVPLEVIIGVAVAVLLIVIVAVDVGCYVTNKTGILMCLCVHVCKKQPPSDKVKEAAALEEGKAKDSKEIKTTEESTPHVTHDDDEAKDATEETPMIDGSKKEKEQEANRNAMENDVNLAKDSAV